MTSQQLLKRINNNWLEFKNSYAGLSKKQTIEEGVAGSWSVKDIIAHVTWWEEESLKHLPLILSGRKSPLYSHKYGGIDAFNAMMTEKKKKLSLEEVLNEQDTTHIRLIIYIERVPFEQIASETRFRRRIRLDAYGHYLHHAKGINEWRKRKGY